MTSVSATLLPNGKQQFFNAAGQPLAGGSVYTYIPNTTTFKTTWVDPYQTTANSNPIILDAGGCAIIYGSGQYRQQVYDSASNLIWDQLTQDFLALVQSNFTYWGGTSAGSANAQTVSTTPSFASYASPNTISFIAGYTNTGATTINANGIGTKNIYKQSLAGPTALTGGEIVAGNIVTLSYDGTEYQIVGSVAGGAQFPGSEVTLSSASTVSIAGQSTNTIAISGTTTITSFGSSGSTTTPFYFVRFTGSLLLTYGSALFIPGGSNLITKNGDYAIVRDYGSNNFGIIAYQRANGAMISATGAEVTVASATNMDLGAAGSNAIAISGTTSVNTFGGSASLANPFYNLRFTGALQLVYNATSMQLPYGTNLNVNAGDTAVAQYLGSSNWKIIFYQNSSGSGHGLINVQIFTGNGTWVNPGASAIEAEIIGGGGGGSGADVSGAAGSGGTSSWGSSNYATGGGGGNGYTGGVGGSGATGGVTTGLVIVGQTGFNSATSGYTNPGGAGGNSLKGFGGGGGQDQGAGNAAYGYGGGGGGAAGLNPSYGPGGGGGGGGYTYIYVNSGIPSSATVTVGGGGTGNGENAGGNGSQGLVIVKSYV